MRETISGKLNADFEAAKTYKSKPSDWLAWIGFEVGGHLWG